MPGISANPDTIVTIDAEARIDENDTGLQDPRTLRQISDGSTAQWLSANGNADSTLYAELIKVMGTKAVSLEEFSRRRAIVFASLIRSGCRRISVFSPTVVRLSQHIRVATLSAGNSHVMIISEDGRLYACGYNDRGQLGLGYVYIHVCIYIYM